MVEITLLEVHLDDSELTATASTPFGPGEKTVAGGGEPPEPDGRSRAGTALGALLGLAVLVVVASASRLVTWLTDYTVPTLMWGALYGYVGLFIAFGVAYFYHRRKV